MFNKGKHQSTKSIALNLFTNKKILLGLLAVAIVAILIPTISFAAEVMDAEGETLPEKVENAINEIIGEPATAPAAPSEDMSNYLCFTPANDNLTFSLLTEGEPTPLNDIKYSDDGGDTWKTLEINTPINISDTIYIKGDNPDGFSKDRDNYFHFNFDNYVNASGNIMSLLDNGTGTQCAIPNNYCFNRLFIAQNNLLTPPELPAIMLTSHCYEYMFDECFSLSFAPQLPATSLAVWCYNQMFRNCDALESPPELPAKNLCDYCYYQMFQSCESLLTAPKLPATTLKPCCYCGMFRDCPHLVEGPYLPAEMPMDRCYENMFDGCSSLKRLSVNFVSWGAGIPTSSWLSSVPNEADCVFVCPESLEIPSRGKSTVPDKWQIVHPMKLEVSDNSVVYDGNEHGINIDTIYPDDATKEFSEDGTTWGSEIKKKDVGEYTVYCRISKEHFDPVTSSAKIIITPSSGASVAFVGGPYTKKYGDKDPDFKMNFLGLATGDTPVINKDYTISRDEGEDVLPANGSYNVYFNWLNPNYLIDPLQTTLTINKATNAKLVADNYSRYSNESDPAKFPAHMEGLKFGDTLADADYVVAKVSDENAETITLHPSLTPTGMEKFSNNYELDFVDGELNVYYSSDQPEFQFAVNADNCTYDGKEHEFKIDMISPQGLAKVEYSVDDGLSWQEEPFKFTEQGTQTVHYRINYTGYTEASGQADITIAPAQLTIVPDACYKNQGEADPTLTAQVYGLAEGESLVPGVDYTLTRAQGEEPGVYDIYCNVANGKLDNYIVTTGNSKFLIAGQDVGTSVAQTGDMSLVIFAVIGFAALIAGGYVAYRKSRKSN